MHMSWANLRSHIRQLIVLSIRKHPLLSAGWVLIMLASASLPTIQIWLQKHSIDLISGLSESSEQLSLAIIMVGAIYFLSFFSTVLGLFENLTVAVLNRDVGYIYLRDILSRTLHIPFIRFDDSSFYDNIQMSIESASRNGIDILQNFFRLISTVIASVSIIVLLTQVHWILPIALFVSAMPGTILLFISKKRRFVSSRESMPLNREQNYTFRLFLQRDASKEVRLFDTGEYLLDKWKHLYLKYRTLLIHQSFKDGAASSLAILILSVFSIGVSIYLVYEISNNQLTIGDYVSLTAAAVTIQGLIGTFGDNLSQVYEKGLYIQNLYEFLDQPGEKDMDEDIVIDEIEHIQLRNVSVVLKDRLVLDNISLDIYKGEKVAIVGENGAGKSTFIYCMLGLYPVNSGQILINGIDLNLLNKKALYKTIAAVFQDFVKYQFSLRENIGFGLISQVDNLDKLKQALEKAELGWLVDELPDKLESILGSQFQSGREISGGQWQRIALARAFLRDSNFVLLDEPTASLDPKAELEIFNKFFEISAGKTSVIVSHRLGPARIADKIVVLQQGKLVEMGNHEELMRRKDIYWTMYTAQSKWYADELTMEEMVSRG